MLIDVHPEADEELGDAAAWYERQEAGLGDLFLDEAEDALERLVDNPLAGAPWLRPELPSGVRRVFFHVFPYAIVYVMRGRPYVVAYSHSSRRPGTGSSDLVSD